MSNILNMEAVQERKLEFFSKQINNKLFSLEKHSAIKEIKLKLQAYNRSQASLFQFKKSWNLFLVLTVFFSDFRTKIKVKY